MDYLIGTRHHGRQIVAEMHFERNARELAWGAVFLAATITVWAVFIIQVAADSGAFNR